MPKSWLKRLKLDNPRSLALLMVSLSGVLYGCMCLFGLLLMQRSFGIFPMLFWRFLLAAVFVAIFAWRRIRVSRHLMYGKELRGLLLGAFLYGASSSLVFAASELIGTGLSMVVFYSFPIFVFIWMWFVRREPVSLLSWLSLLAVCAGLYFLNHDAPREDFDSTGIVLALASSALYACYILYSERQAADVDPWLSTFSLCVLSSAYFLGLSLLRGEFMMLADLDSWVIAIALGIFATALPILLLLIGLQNLRPDLASVLSVFEPIVTVVLGVLFLGESLSYPQLGGIFIVLLGAICTTLCMAKDEIEQAGETEKEASSLLN